MTNMTTTQQTTDEHRRPHFGRSRFWNQLMENILGSRKGGAQIVVDAQDADQGIGKTSEAIALSRYISRAFDYEMTEADVVMDGEAYLKRLRDHPDAEQPSVIYFDELVGGGAGDARRAMSNVNVMMARAWEMLRSKRIISVGTLSHFGDMDPRFKRFTNYRLYCMHPVGVFRTYRIHVDFDSGKVKTRTLDDHIYFPDISGDDPLYEYIEGIKADTIDETILNAKELFGSDSSNESSSNGVDTDATVEKIVENPEPVTSVHGVTGEDYIDHELIRYEFDLTHRKARQVKKIAEKQLEDV